MDSECVDLTDPPDPPRHTEPPPHKHTHTDGLLFTHIAVGWRHDQLFQHATMDGECVDATAGVDVPEDDGEVLATREQVVGLVARAVVEGVQQAGHPALVALQHLHGDVWGTKMDR